MLLCFKEEFLRVMVRGRGGQREPPKGPGVAVFHAAVGDLDGLSSRGQVCIFRPVDPEAAVLEMTALALMVDHRLMPQHEYPGDRLGFCADDFIADAQSAASQMRSMRVLESLTLEIYLQGVEDHRQIAEAVAAGDARGARDAVAEHLGKDYAEYLREA